MIMMNLMMQESVTLKKVPGKQKEGEGQRNSIKTHFCVCLFYVLWGLGLK